MTSPFIISDSNRNTSRTVGNSGGTFRAFAGLKNVFTSGTLTEVKCYLDNDTTGTSGNVQCIVYTSTGTDPRILDSIAVSTLTSSMAEYTFTGSVTVNTGDLIGFQMDSTPSSAYRFNVGIQSTSSQISSVESWNIDNSGTVTTMMSGSDYLYLCGISITYSTGSTANTFYPPPPAYITL